MAEVQQPGEQLIEIRDGHGFVVKQDVQPSDSPPHYAYEVQGRDNYVIGIEEGTKVALELYDVNGDPLDTSTQVKFQKVDPQRNPLGDAIIFETGLGQFDYNKMYSDPQFFKTTSDPLLLDEKEFLHVYLDVPSGAANFDASRSRITVGDKVTQTAKPVFMRRKDDLSKRQRDAVNANRGQ